MDASSAQGAAAVTGAYAGVVAAGTYIFYAPADSVTIVRYDTAQSFTSLAAWAQMSLSAVLAATPVNNAYKGISYDSTNKFVYFCPQDSATFIRYNMASTFTSAASWELIAMSSAQGNTALTSAYNDCAFDGTYVYYCPQNSDTFIRFNTGVAFTAITSWQQVPINSTWQAAVINNAFQGCCYDSFNRNIVYAPLDSTTWLRYDTREPFTDPWGWEMMASHAAPPGNVASAHDGVCFDGTVVHYCPLNSDTFYSWYAPLGDDDYTGFYTAGGGGRVYESSDGAAWSLQRDFGTGKRMACITGIASHDDGSGEDLYVLVNFQYQTGHVSANQPYCYKYDGTTWTRLTGPYLDLGAGTPMYWDGRWIDPVRCPLVSYTDTGGTKLYTAGMSSANKPFASSTDGITWSFETPTYTTGYGRWLIEFNGDLYGVIDQSGTAVKVHKKSAGSWDAGSTITGLKYCHGVAECNGSLYLMGATGTTSATGGLIYKLISGTWTKVATLSTMNTANNNTDFLISVGNVLVAGSNNDNIGVTTSTGNKAYVSIDGYNWELRPFGGATPANTAAGTAYSGPANTTTFNNRVYLAGQEYEAASNVRVFRSSDISTTPDPFWEQASMNTVLGATPSNAYRGASCDGRYVYFAPCSSSTLIRYDTQSPFTSASAWQKMSLTSAGASVAAAFFSTVFDGQYVYYVPFDSATFIRFDTRQAFTSINAWTQRAISSITAAAAAGSDFAGVTFDGRYLYFAPQNSVTLVRFRTRNVNSDGLTRYSQTSS